MADDNEPGLKVYVGTVPALDYNDEYYSDTEGVEIVGAALSEEDATRAARDVILSWGFAADEPAEWWSDNFRDEKGLVWKGNWGGSENTATREQFLEWFAWAYASARELEVELPMSEVFDPVMAEAAQRLTDAHRRLLAS